MLSLVRHKPPFKVVGVLVVLLLMLGTGYHYVSTYIESHKYYTPYLSHVKELYSLTPVRDAPKEITSTVFTFRDDRSGKFFDVFALQKRATKYCDKDSTIDGCDVKLPNNYNVDTLSAKLVDALELMCKEPVKTDFYVKIDDGLIMPDSMLEDALRVMAATDCQVAGGIAKNYGVYWPLGQIYIFKRTILERICARFPVTMDLSASEDITFGKLVNSTDQSVFCNMETPKNHWYRRYKDRRVRIDYLNNKAMR